MESKEELEWILNKTEKYQDRYMKAENLLYEIYNLPWYKRLFCGFMISKYVNELDD